TPQHDSASSALLCALRLRHPTAAEASPLSLHDALPISVVMVDHSGENQILVSPGANSTFAGLTGPERAVIAAGDVLLLQQEIPRSEEHTSELQSLTNLVCRLLLAKKNKRDPESHADRPD